MDEVRTVRGLGEVAPVALRIIREAAALYLRQASEGMEVRQDRESLSEFWRMRIGGHQNEVFEVAYLDSGYRLLPHGVERLQEGTIDRAAVYPRRVVEAALRRGAAAVVLAHNHPNSRVEPSEQDKLVTRAIVLVAETVSISACGLSDCRTSRRRAIPACGVRSPAPAPFCCASVRCVSAMPRVQICPLSRIARFFRSQTQGHCCRMVRNPVRRILQRGFPCGVCAWRNRASSALP